MLPEFYPLHRVLQLFPSYISSAKSFYAKTWRSTTETDTVNCSVLPQCTVTCGQGLRYRVVLCIDHRGLHAGGCNPTTKPHIKEECLVTVPCYKPIGGAFFLSWCFKLMSNSKINHPSSFPLWGISLRYPPSRGQACVAQAGHRAGGGDRC